MNIERKKGARRRTPYAPHHSPIINNMYTNTVTSSPFVPYPHSTPSSKTPIPCQLQFQLSPYNKYEYIVDKIPTIYPDEYLLRTAIKLKNSILWSCSVRFQFTQNAKTYHLYPDNNRVQIPLYFCEFGPSSTGCIDGKYKKLLDNHRLFSIGRKAIGQLIEWPRFPQIHLEFDRNVHVNSLYHSVPIRHSMSELLSEYIPFVDVINHVLLPYVGYDVFGFVGLRGSVQFGYEIQESKIEMKYENESQHKICFGDQVYTVAQRPHLNYLSDAEPPKRRRRRSSLSDFDDASSSQSVPGLFGGFDDESSSSEDSSF